MFLASLDGTVISTLLAPISTEFQSFASVSWLTTGFLIAQAACQPLFGKLTDIYGRQRVLLICNALFFVGTLGCGLARGPGAMVVARVVAGAGGGGLTAIPSMVATDLVPLRRRGIAQGFASPSQDEHPILTSLQRRKHCVRCWRGHGRAVWRNRERYVRVCMDVGGR